MEQRKTLKELELKVAAAKRAYFADDDNKTLETTWMRLKQELKTYKKPRNDPSSKPFYDHSNYKKKWKKQYYEFDEPHSCTDCLSIRYCTRRMKITFYTTHLDTCTTKTANKEAKRTLEVAPDTAMAMVAILQNAAYNNNIALVQQVLQRATRYADFDINHATSTGGTPLIYACQHGSAEIVRLLIQKSKKNNQEFFWNSKIDVNQELLNGRTPLFMASQMGYLECVKLLIAVPTIELNKAKHTGETPLLIASQEGYLNCVEILLQEKTKILVNKATKNGRTPLHIASFRGHVAVVKLLIKHGADINQQKQNGKTALWIACQKGILSVIKILLKYPTCDINQCDSVDRASPLHTCCDHGHKGCVERLLTCPNILINAAKNDGATALYMASQNGHVECVRLLLNHSKIQINQCRDGGFSPLHVVSFVKKNLFFSFFVVILLFYFSHVFFFSFD